MVRCTCTTCTISTIIILFLAITIPVRLITSGAGTKNPAFSVESTLVKAYNLTSENRLFCIIRLEIRAQNPNPRKHSFRLYGIDMEVRKGKHHKLADDALPGFGLGPGGEAVVGVEAVGLMVGLRREIAEEVRGDVAAGGGRVNVFMGGNVGPDYLRVTCKGVGVDFSRVNVRVDQRVRCRVSVAKAGDGA